MVVRVNLRDHPDHGVHLEQGNRRGGTLEIDLLQDTRREHVRIHLETDLERRGRVNGLLDYFVQMKRVGPELLVAEGGESKNLLTVRERLRRKIILHCFRAGRGVACHGLGPGRALAHPAAATAPASRSLLTNPVPPVRNRPVGPSFARAIVVAIVPSLTPGHGRVCRGSRQSR
jgi:hypothetical protein